MSRIVALLLALSLGGCGMVFFGCGIGGSHSAFCRSL